MDHNFECHHRAFNLRVMKRATKPALLHDYGINFNFIFQLKRFYWVQNLDSMSRDFVGQDASYIKRTSANVIVNNSSLYKQIVEAVERALTPLPLSDDERHQLIECAWEEACEYYMTVEFSYDSCEGYIDMDLDFQLLSEHDHVFYSSGEINRCRMVPAADSCVQSLKKFEVDSGNIMEGSCCICLEDLSGDHEGCEALGMPCQHVFHGDCIKRWLRTSHYCPLCRFEMPTS